MTKKNYAADAYQSPTWTVRSFINDASYIITDDAFERPHGCWGRKDKHAFIESVFRGHASSALTLANVDRCARHSKKVEDTDSENWFSRRKQEGAQWVSIDGKHRRGTLEAFIAPNATIPGDGIGYTGSVVDLDGNVEKVKNRKFKDLTKEQQQRFLSSALPITEYVAITRSEMAEIFKAIAGGRPLNAQQKRNAESSPFAALMRDFAKNHPKMVEMFYSVNEVASMKPEEDLSKTWIHIEDEAANSNPTPSSLDKLYERGTHIGIDGRWEAVYEPTSYKMLEGILCELERIASTHPSDDATSTKMLLPMLALHQTLRHDYDIADPEVFFKEIIALDRVLNKRSRRMQVNDEESGELSRVTKSESDGNYYHEWCRLNWNKTRSSRANYLWKVMAEEPAKFGIEKRSAMAAK